MGHVSLLSHSGSCRRHGSLLSCLCSLLQALQAASMAKVVLQKYSKQLRGKNSSDLDTLPAKEEEKGSSKEARPEIS